MNKELDWLKEQTEEEETRSHIRQRSQRVEDKEYQFRRGLRYALRKIEEVQREASREVEERRREQDRDTIRYEEESPFVTRDELEGKVKKPASSNPVLHMHPKGSFSVD